LKIDVFVALFRNFFDFFASKVPVTVLSNLFSKEKKMFGKCHKMVEKVPKGPLRRKCGIHLDLVIHPLRFSL